MHEDLIGPGLTLDPCPHCGSTKVRRLYTGGAILKEIVENDPAVDWLLMRNKAHYESRSDEIRSGELQLIERGNPRYFPEPPDKRFH